jgi:OmpA-OmpF porin, OOP family
MSIMESLRRTAVAAGLGMFTLGLPLAAGAAGEPGWYFGGGGFYSSMEDSDNRSRTPDTFDPGAPGACLIDLGGLARLLCGPDTPPSFVPGETLRSTTKFDDGYGGSVVFGYALEGGLRPEMAITYSQNDFDEFAFDGADSSSVDGKVKALNVMANGWFDIDLNRVWPYFGAGVGFQQTKYSGDLGSDDDATVTYQVGGGVGIPLTDYTTLSIDYRYRVADDPKLDFGDDFSTKTEYSAHNIGASLRYALGTGAGRDSDGDGVPDRKDKCPNTPKGVQVYSDGCPVDLDQDGVPDYLDKCPNTPAGTPVNAEGCPFDSDGDGVPDHLDQCPGTPTGVKVDGKGCPLDSDGDGVPDYLDKCPETPVGQAVNAQGCEISDKDGDGIPDHLDKCPDSDPSIKVGPDGCPLDSDGDGIPDHLDECPNTPPGLKVLPNGCALVGDCRKPRPGEAVDAKGCAVDQRFILRGVKFEFDSDKLTKPAELILNDVADTLAAYPDVTVEVQGHTDSLGTDAYNLGLSERRSNSVKRYLAGRGVNGDRLRPVGYGEAQPIADNGTAEGQEENRRVEFRVIER